MTFSKSIILLIFCASFAYIGLILAVGIHEVFGHGLAYEISGHNFVQFVLKPDGMGWAEAEYSHNPTVAEEIFILLAGPVSTYIASILLFLCGFIFRRYLWWLLSFIILGLMSLMDGGPYMLWNSINPVQPGDFGRVLELIPDYRILFVVLGGVLTIGGIIFSNLLIYKSLFKWFGDFSSRRWSVIILMFFLQLVGWLSFDWNQIAPGVSYWPQVSAIVITSVALFFIGFTSIKPKEMPIVTESWKVALVSSVVLALLFVCFTFFWFQNGVKL